MLTAADGNSLAEKVMTAEKSLQMRAQLSNPI